MFIFNLYFLLFNTRTYTINVNGQEYTVTKDMVKEIKRYEKEVHGKEFYFSLLYIGMVNKFCLQFYKIHML